MDKKLSDLNVLIMANYPNSTGYAWKNIYRLFERIADRIRHEFKGKVFISFPVIEKKSTLIGLEKFNDVGQFSTSPSSLRELIRLLTFIVRNKIRFIYLTDQSSTQFYFALMRLCGVRRIIVHSRVSVASPLPDIERRFLVIYLKRLIRLIPLFNAQRIYTVSDFVRNRLIFKAGVKKGSVITIMNGININRFEKNYDYPFPETDENIKIFTCGRVAPEKGFQFLIKAVPLINADLKRRCSLYIGGDGPYFETLKHLVNELGIEQYVHLLGEIRDVTAYQKHADINVVPSIWGDACPSSISESLCANRPLICTRAGGIPEMIKTSDGTEAAIVVPPSDSDALAFAIKQILASPDTYKQIADKGYRHATSKLTEDAYYSRFFNYFLNDLGLTTAN